MKQNFSKIKKIILIFTFLMLITFIVSLILYKLGIKNSFVYMLPFFIGILVGFIDSVFSTIQYDKEKKEIEEYYDIAKEAILSDEEENSNLYSTEFLATNETFSEISPRSKKFLSKNGNTKLLENLEKNNEKNKNSSYYKKTRTKKEPYDILKMMALNMREIKEYYVLSKNMAKKSFSLSAAMCVFGFLAITSSIIAIFLTDINFMEALVPVIGGAIVEIIAGTTLVVYKKSLEQLNKYYDALHNNERFLSLVNLVDKLSDDKKDEVYIDIINNQLLTLNGIDADDHAELKQ